jgi:hypothetical protein
MRVPPLSDADSTIIAFSPVNGFQTTSPARTRQADATVADASAGPEVRTRQPGRARAQSINLAQIPAGTPRQYGPSRHMSRVLMSRGFDSTPARMLTRAGC